MRQVSVKEARANFKALLDRAQAGEEIILLRRGKAVARLVPPSQEGRRLPRLGGFRKELSPKGAPLSRDIVAGRDKGRF